MTQTNCPACGAQITFQYGSSMVVVCEHCHSAVARTDRNLEDLGKVAALLDTGSPLRVGLDGRYGGVTFVISGRVQLQHSMGGVWDEWYAAFGDGRWGWLAEAQGRFYLTFLVQSPPDIPAISALQPGERVPGSLNHFVVDEIGEAAARSGEGEIPWRVVPGDRYDYADLSASGGRFATIDYSEDKPLLFGGKIVTLDELGISKSAAGQTTRVKAARLQCPHCGGPIDLRMPDQTQRVTCSHCGSFLDVDEGNLKYLHALDHKAVEPLIPLGTKGKIDNIEWTVVGFLQRSVKIEGEKYYWFEYLLYEPRSGFRWLVHSDGHWSFAQPIQAGEVVVTAKSLTYQGRTFKIYQGATARVEYVLGEFYWKVSVGEAAGTADYIDPPAIISRELATGEGSEEVAYTYGVYMPVRDVQDTFHVKGLPSPTGVAPNQPNPHSLKVWRDFLLFSLIALVLAIIFSATGERRVLLDQNFALEPLATGEQSKVIFTDPLEVKGHKNLEIDAEAQVENAWINLDADLVDEQNGFTEQFSIPVEYYHGVDDGESWSEGSSSKQVFVAAVPEGRYTLRLEFQWEGTNPPVSSIHVRMREGVPRFFYAFLVIGALAIYPFLAIIRRASFEGRRWNDSMFSPNGTAKS
ncbi:MAG TPA: DUF4178 domain-containing protein [Thermoanaerobaculia bacterium]|nr:DUF4178 domain-containing protein [Thermoanaerobaculia bacterium]